MPQQTRQVGDTRVAIAGAFKRPDGTVVPLTGLETNVWFTMVRRDGTDKVAETQTNVLVTNAAGGEVQYAPQAADVDEAGTFYAYFIIIAPSGAREHFPVKSRALKILIEPEA